MDFLGGLLSGAANLIGGMFNRSSAQSIAQQNIQAQELFAQQGLQWRAQDATRAQAETGINRLALLGAPTSSFSNIVGDSGAFGQGIANAGQDIGRAITAGNPQAKRVEELNAQLLEAKISNVNADTVRQQAEASAIARKFASPGTMPSVAIPLPQSDPRGPVIQLMQRARDWRTGEIVDIPSEKAASPLQTLGALPLNAALAGKSLERALGGWENSFFARPDVLRSMGTGWGP